MTWQPIETAPRDADLLFWVVSKSAEEAYVDSSGKPIVSHAPPRLHRGRFGSWSALSKATHWRPLPEPPPTLDELRPVVSDFVDAIVDKEPKG